MILLVPIPLAPGLQRWHVGYHRLPSATIGYHRLPSDTDCLLPSRCLLASGFWLATFWLLASAWLPSAFWLLPSFSLQPMRSIAFCLATWLLPSGYRLASGSLCYLPIITSLLPSPFYLASAFSLLSLYCIAIIQPSYSPAYAILAD